MKKIIQTPNAPAPIGPYSQAVEANGMVYLSGQIALNPQTGELVSDSIQAETHQVMKNIGAVLKACELDFKHIVKCSIFLSDMDSFSEVNGVYGNYFDADFPARECVQVAKLPKGVNVEITALAVRP